MVLLECSFSIMIDLENIFNRFIMSKKRKVYRCISCDKKLKQLYPEVETEEGWEAIK